MLAAMENLPHLHSKHFVLQCLAQGTYAALAQDGGAAISNAGIIDLGDQVVIFDSLLTPQAAMDLRRFAEELTGHSPQIVVNSHYHNDHIWGNQAFGPGALILSSSRTRDLIATAGMEEYRWYSSNSAQRLEALQEQSRNTEDEAERSKLAMWLGYYAGLVEALPHLSVCLPGITFNSRLKLHGSKQSAELIAFDNAHTGSDTVLYLPQEGILFMSDLLFVGCHPYLADGDPLQLLKALQELSQSGASRLVPGHGPVGTLDDLNLLVEYIEYSLQTAQALVAAGTIQDDRLAELKMPEKYAHWQYPQFFLDNMRFLCERLKSPK
jgi:cyclase